MKCENLLNKILPYLILAFAFLALMGWDYSDALGDVYRGGRMRYLLMGLAVCQYFYLQGINPWWAAFSAWSFFLWCFFNFSAFGAADVALIPACLLMGDMLRRLLRSSTVLMVVGHLALAQGIYGLLQILGIDPFFPNLEPAWKNWAIGTFGHHTLLAPFLAMGAIYFWTRPPWPTPFNWLAATFLSAMVFATGSSMGIGSLLAAALYAIWRFRPRVGLLAGSCCALGLLGAFALNPRTELFNNNGRVLAYGKAWQGVVESPVLGHGPGAFMEKHTLWGLDEKSMGMNWNQAHQEYLQAWIETGAIGLALILAGLFFTLRICQNLQPVYGAWALVLAVNSLANFTMHFAAFGLLAGWLAAVTWHKRSEE